MTQPDLFPIPDAPSLPGKTMIMPRYLLEGWLEALRSGKFAKGRDYLKFEDDEGCTRYCCLGVLQEINGGVEEGENGDDGANVPTAEWWKERGVKIIPSATGTPDPRTPFVPGVGDSILGSLITSINDKYEPIIGDKYTFSEIADMIERITETY